MLDRVFAPDSLFSRRFYFLAKRFVPGSHIEDALESVRRLNAQGMTATLDFLGEDVLDPAAAAATRDTYLRMLDRIAASSARSNVSVKLTAMGLLLSEDLALQNLRAVLEYAQSANPSDPFVRIDMEGSNVTQATLRIFERAYETHKNVGPVLQAYLKRTPSDVEQMIALGARVRLCKGAYSEPPDIALKSMNDIRLQYLQCAAQLLTRGNYPGIATHDRRLISAIKRYAQEHSITSDRFEFQMLYGVRPALQRRLVTEGYRVRIYVPFGTHWAGYFYRRVAERRENALFALSSIFTR
ncbi:MAG TPA: proline dehydrogenase family protein [Candidatus Baltobacteraceae bacterium]|nr:proline dehydrogenase family protein [Candidatus Baltobacteraceae bacterium]